MSDYGLKTDNDFNGPVATLIKVIKACEKAGLDSKNVINILKRQDQKQVLKQINDFSFKKTEEQRKLEELKAQEERANAFGIGQY